MAPIVAYPLSGPIRPALASRAAPDRETTRGAERRAISRRIDQAGDGGVTRQRRSAAKRNATGASRAEVATKPNAARRDNSICSGADYGFLLTVLIGWLALPCDSLYAEPPDFGLSALGFLASLLPLS
jgi:hypothetical protein